MTEYDKTSPNAVAVRDKIRSTAVTVVDKADELSDFVSLLASRVWQAQHIVDGDREDTEELIADLNAAQTALSRITAKAQMIARRTKTSTTITVLP